MLSLDGQMIVLPTAPCQNLRPPQIVALGIGHKCFVTATPSPRPGIRYAYRLAFLGASFPPHNRAPLTSGRALHKHRLKYLCAYVEPIARPRASNLPTYW